MKVSYVPLHNEVEASSGILLELDLEASDCRTVFQVVGYGICLLLAGIGLLCGAAFNKVVDVVDRIFTSTRGGAMFCRAVLIIAALYMSFILIDTLLSGALTTEIR